MNRMKELRTERGLSFRGLAIKTGINFSSLSKYENETRMPGIDEIKTLASFYEVSIDYLLNYDGFCLFVTYENGKCMYRVNKIFYDYLVENDFIYFNNQDNRCINLNKLVGVSENSTLNLLIEDLVRISNFDKLFEKGKATLEEFENANTVVDITLNLKIINELKRILELQK